MAPAEGAGAAVIGAAGVVAGCVAVGVVAADAFGVVAAGAVAAGVVAAAEPAAPVCGAGVVGAASLLQPSTALKPIHAQALLRAFLRVFMSVPRVGIEEPSVTFDSTLYNRREFAEPASVAEPRPRDRNARSLRCDDGTTENHVDARFRIGAHDIADRPAQPNACHFRVVLPTLRRVATRTRVLGHELRIARIPR